MKYNKKQKMNVLLHELSLVVGISTMMHAITEILDIFNNKKTKEICKKIEKTKSWVETEEAFERAMVFFVQNKLLSTHHTFRHYFKYLTSQVKEQKNETAKSIH